MKALIAGESNSREGLKLDSPSLHGVYRKWSRVGHMEKFLYIFLDESGNFDFSPKGTKYFVLTSVTKERPFHAYKDLCELKYDLIEAGGDREHFHATEDPQIVRDRVFTIIQQHIEGIRIDAVIVEKSKTLPAWHEVAIFYPKMLGYLLRHVCAGMAAKDYTETIIITDQIPVRKKREAIIKGIKESLSQMLPSKNYRVLHHDSKSSFDLQIADYCCWAIYKKWEAQENRPIATIKTALAGEYEIFAPGTDRFSEK